MVNNSKIQSTSLQESDVVMMVELSEEDLTSVLGGYGAIMDIYDPLINPHADPHHYDRGHHRYDRRYDRRHDRRYDRRHDYHRRY